MMLSVRDLGVNYGSVAAVRGIDLDIHAGEIVALLGANGAGKTTIARAVAGLLPFQGEVRFEDRLLKPNAAERNLRAGISLVPEGRGILARMTVDENLLMGIYCRPDKREAMSDVKRMLARFPILEQRRHRPASLLSGGEQQLLAIARACLSKPRLLLLDEPSLGLAPKMTEHVFGMIGELRTEGLTILLIEQKARQTLKFADRAYLLETGRMVTSGTASELAQDSIVSETFLGAGAREARHAKA
jgi:branched-chain amino acid transport system ATP-binding protein